MLDLSFVREKIKRADVHLKAADAIAKAHCESDFYSWRAQMYRQRRYQLRVISVEEFPADFPIMVGEIAYQLRSALDHIAFMCCRTTDRKEQKRIQFPFARSKACWKGEATNRLPKVSRRARPIFERFQPYHSRKEPGVKLLAYVNAVNKWEKHRAPATAFPSVTSSQGAVKTHGVALVNFKRYPRRMIEVGAILATFEVAKPIDSFKMEIHTKTGFSPVFDKRMPEEIRMVGVFKALGGASDFMRKTVVPAFERLP